MRDNFKYEFDSSTGILYKSYFGPITIEDISLSWIFAMENNLIPKDVRGYILDYRNATFDISLDEYSDISSFYRLHLDFFSNKKIAVVTEEPKDIVIPTLVQDDDDGYLSKPFFGIRAAEEWILS